VQPHGQRLACRRRVGRVDLDARERPGATSEIDCGWCAWPASSEPLQQQPVAARLQVDADVFEPARRVRRLRCACRCAMRTARDRRRSAPSGPRFGPAMRTGVCRCVSTLPSARPQDGGLGGQLDSSEGSGAGSSEGSGGRRSGCAAGAGAEDAGTVASQAGVGGKAKVGAPQFAVLHRDEALSSPAGSGCGKLSGSSLTTCVSGRQAVEVVAALGIGRRGRHRSPSHRRTPATPGSPASGRPLRLQSM